jgi:glycosyltransferase involved in cell wall biosynthesis
VKILYVNNAKLCGGAEEHLMDIGTWLREHGESPSFLVRDVELEKDLKGRVDSRDTATLTREVFRNRVEASGFPTFPYFYSGIRRVFTLFRIAALLRRTAPDIISVNREHTIYPMYAALLMARPFLGKRPRIFAVFHTPTGRYYPVLKKYDGVIATSRYTADAFIRKNPEIAERVAVIHYGISLPALDGGERFDRLRKRRYFRNGSFPIIGMVGELWKNQEELIDVAALLKGSFPGLLVAIVGGGTEATLAALQAKIDARGLADNFVLTGKVDRSLINDIFHDMDLSVTTHRNEGFGIVHLESMAAGTPVVSYHNGGVVEIIRNGGGVLVDGGTADFAETVRTLLNDDERRYALGREGRKVVEELFSIDAMSRNHLDYYRSFFQ